MKRPRFGGVAIEDYLTSLIGVSSADEVDGDSRATYTSAAVKEALAKALAAAKGEAVENTAPLAFTAGDYTASAMGYNGAVEMKVTFSDTAVTAIEAVSSLETESVGTPAIDILAKDIVAAQRHRRGRRVRRDLHLQRGAQRRERRRRAGRVHQPGRVQGQQAGRGSRRNHRGDL